MALEAALIGVPVAMATAAATEQLAAAGLRALLLAQKPLSGEHLDSRLYHRQLLTPHEPQMLTLGALLASAGLAAVLGFAGAWPWLMLAVMLWMAALGWDMWHWERAAASVKFVAWRRGWQRSARRLAVTEIKEVHVVEKVGGWSWMPQSLRPTACYVALVRRDGSAVKLPRTGTWFGGLTRVENLANFVRMQIDIVSDTRKRVAADKRRAAKRAVQESLRPVHPAARPQRFPLQGS
ncbi:hypothetical protein [Caldimonas sp. KR1-144]|uniref:hypothetical protein n=1 Tax=Caldimonas sp. KR1-144 TaxID=3400911 RepID=UPI003C0874E5